MAILSNRGKIKNNQVEYGNFFFYLLKKLFVILLIIISLYFLQFSYPKPVKDIITNITGKVLSVTEYISTSIAKPFSDIYTNFLYLKQVMEENILLKEKNHELQRVVSETLFVKSENKLLRDILRIQKDKKQQIINAKIIGTSITPYSQRAIINAGDQQGVKVDYIVRGVNGLLGRVIEVNAHYSTIILIGDRDFRISVLSIGQNSHGILIKHNNYLKIIYLEDNHNFKVGNIVYTSGDGNIFYSGIPVGIVSKITDNEVYVKLIERINSMGFVIIEPSVSSKIK